MMTTMTANHPLRPPANKDQVSSGKPQAVSPNSAILIATATATATYSKIQPSQIQPKISRTGSTSMAGASMKATRTIRFKPRSRN